ncbi:MAG: glycosyl transferase [Nocardioides sp.]|nr:glycosyl transferase [Nocardioides sp.]
MRGDQELDIRSLYIWPVTTMSSSDPASDASAAENEGAGKSDAAASSYASADVGLEGYGRITDEGEAVVEAGRRITFGTYFNAFPASYWRRWSVVDAVQLRVRVRGQGSVIVYRSTSKGHVLRAGSLQVDTTATGASETHTFDLPLKPFIDGGWYWFDLEGGDDELTLEAADWVVETDRTVAGKVTVGITTFNRPDFCVNQLLAMAADPDTLAVLEQVLVVDQGTQKVVDSPEFAQASEMLGDKLRIIDQPNLGGSGGFSRAMHEASQGAADYVLLLDDDVECELEGIRRAVAFADLARTPTIVGGHMFSLFDRTVMHAYGETMEKWLWFWGPAPSTIHGHDFARIPLRSTKWLHRRIDVDYNGWWMCLIPTEVVRKIGLSLPMFIKWDDAEYGLRAQAAGFPTVSMPGVAVWHVPWTEKDDTLDWQAYFHQRNRLISGLLHSPYEHGGKLLVDSLQNHTKRMTAMQYSSGELILLATEDVLAGPDRMHRDLRERLAEIRALRSGYRDAQPRSELDFFPAPRRKKPPRKGKGIPNPTKASGKVKLGITGLVRQAFKTRELSEDFPEGIVPHVDQKWYRLSHYDSAIVTSADGTTAVWHKRDRKEFFDQTSRSAVLHAKLYKNWASLKEQYTEALPHLTSSETWSESFGIDGSSAAEVDAPHSPDER